jgi:AAA15 family ATPase/GTPase
MLQKITLKNFQRFASLENQALGNITLIIGENDTGKTGLLKIIYAASKSLEMYSRQYETREQVPYKKLLGDKLDNTFQPRETQGIGALVTKGSKEKLSVELDYSVGRKTTSHVFFSFSESARKVVVDVNSHINPLGVDFNTLFVPAKEVLTALKAIKYTRDPGYLAGFDDTYLDLITALERATSRGKVSASLVTVNQEIEDLFEGKIEQTDKDDLFVFRKGNQEFSMSLTAEGVKKIGILTTLIRNRSLNQHTILLLDEPETALHPKAIRAFVGMLIHLAKAGVQIFLTSHSYFVAKQLAICARKNTDLAIQCCSLHQQGGVVEAAFSDMRDGLPNNPIIDAALEMFDEEVGLDFADL